MISKSFSTKDLQTMFALSQNLETKGVEGGSNIRKVIQQELHQRRKAYGQMARKMTRSNRKGRLPEKITSLMKMSKPCPDPSCGATMVFRFYDAEMNPTLDMENIDSGEFICKKCRYSEFVNDPLRLV